jgi:signal peptidase II
MTLKNLRPLIPFAWLTVAVLLVDQVTKYLALDLLGFEGSSLKLLPVFNLTLIFNPGVSFGMLGSLGQWGPYCLTALSATLVIYIVIWAHKTQRKSERFAFAMIIGGAVGNMIDRLRLGKVIDFLDFYIHTYHWPAFNFADAMICIGVFLLLWSQLLTYRSEKNSA